MMVLCVMKKCTSVRVKAGKKDRGHASWCADSYDLCLSGRLKKIEEKERGSRVEGVRVDG